ncbi:unnamed protein product [Rotaria sordida]|uniref:Uncharacterized protein n=1 Tax=Rotaria sordida TaxID=392033 RepID=A0A815SCB6_9BILA|nr:unnamed protein product [Rotaria sordida]CAF1650715.1 unnamed protein product [Rotaria sordida]
MINKCTSRKELSFFDHQSTVIRPINVLLDIRQTTLIGSVAKKSDVKHVALEQNQLEVPQNRTNEDIVLSSADKFYSKKIIQMKFVFMYLSWVSVQCSPDQYVVFNVMTPPGLGIHLRQPSLLKYLFHLHGSHIEQTSFFNKHIY